MVRSFSGEPARYLPDFFILFSFPPLLVELLDFFLVKSDQGIHTIFLQFMDIPDWVYPKDGILFSHKKLNFLLTSPSESYRIEYRKGATGRRSAT